tara:strand:- start:15365 stop:16444 length:1080 start_codon:yes stop_codon:yes gene_type:complete
MLKILDTYIIKKYLTTFFVSLFLFIPIGIMVDVAERIDKFKENEIPFSEIISYYLDFMWYFGNLLFPILLFLSVIWFTSKLANNTEIISILSSGVSFSRFLRPYFFSALLIASISFYLGMFVVPKASRGFNEFNYKYLNKKAEIRNTSRVFKQISKNEFVYVSSYNPTRERAMNFTLEHFDNEKLKFKIMAQSIRWIKSDSVFRLLNYKKRIIYEDEEILIKKKSIDTIFNFNIQDLSPLNYEAETLTLFDLNKFIDSETKSGSKLINKHLLVRHKRYSLPFSVFVLTLISVSVSSVRRRGGMGINLALGILMGFSFIFIDKVLVVLVNKSNFSAAVAAWSPIIFFGSMGLYLMRYAKK